MQKIIFRLVVVMLSLMLVQACYANTHRSAEKINHSSSSLVNINTADAKTFSTLKGIGLKKAQTIVNYREKNGNFKSVEDLAAVKGIGKKGLSRIEKNNPRRMVINP